jgi:hypothetical protein
MSISTLNNQLFLDVATRAPGTGSIIMAFPI